MRHQALFSLALIGLLPSVALADEARAILEKTYAKQVERWEGVDTYRVEQSLAGTRVTMDFRRVETIGPDGRPVITFQPSRTVSAGASAAGGDGQTMSPQDLERFAQGQEMTGAAVATGIEDGLEQAGLPRGLLSATGSDPTATFDPRVMMGANAEFLRGAAKGQKVIAAEEAQNQKESAAQMAAFLQKARLVGRENVDGRDAFHVRAEELNHTQQSGGDEFTLQTVSLWIDSSDYVPLRTRMDGVARSKGESRPMTIEKVDGDYRKVPGSKMYEPYRQVMRFSGVLSPEQQQEMRESQKKIADMEQQLASMPEGQRQMIMRQMGPQMQMMKSMAAGGGVEMVTEIHQITINPPKEAAQPAALPAAAPPVPSAVAAASSSTGSAAVPTPSSNVPDDAAARRRAEEACLKNKMAKAEAAQKKKRGFGTLLNAASRAAGMLGNQDLVKTAGDVGTATATAGDLASAARDLGITEDEIAACQATP
jgi:hypothetical protein